MYALQYCFLNGFGYRKSLVQIEASIFQAQVPPKRAYIWSNLLEAFFLIVEHTITDHFEDCIFSGKHCEELFTEYFASRVLDKVKCSGLNVTFVRAGAEVIVNFAPVNFDFFFE